MFVSLLCSVVALTNTYAVLSFDGSGAVDSLREVVSGRELIGERVPFVSIRLKDGTSLASRALKCADGELVFSFGRQGTCRLGVTPFNGGWTFETRAFDVADAELLTFARVRPLCNARKGGMSNIVEDDESAVVIRAYSPELEMNRTDFRGINELVDRSRDTWCAVKREFGFVGKRCGLSAGPRKDILEMLKGMAAASGLRVNRVAGPWSRTAEINRLPVLFATWMDYESLDDWIRLMDKAGSEILHFHAWWKTRGTYKPDQPCFPGGLEQMREAVRRVHAAGKHATTHSLAAAAQFGDPFISPEWYDDFVTFRSYTLAKPYKSGDDALYVNEQPWEKHAKVMTGSTFGNVLRLGDDLLQYDDFSRTPPYRFTGVRMALQPFGEEETYDNTQAVSRNIEEFAKAKTKSVRKLSRASYPEGTRVDYLNQRCAEFFPRPGSRLARVMIGVISNFYHTCGFEGIYLDGSEPWGSRYNIDKMRYDTIAALCGETGTVFTASSCRQPFDWWQRSIVGSWDHPIHGPRAFHDRHIRVSGEDCAADYNAVDLGWWNTQTASVDGRGYYPEEMEYFGCKSAANDMNVSIMGALVTDGPLAFQMDDQLTLAGWWAKARYARAFKSGLQKRMAVPGEDWRMRQDETGRWTVRRLFADCHKVASEDFAKWNVKSSSAMPAELRVAALYGADHAQTAKAMRLLDVTHEKDLELTAADGVHAEFGVVDDPERGRVLRLAAKNGAAPRNAAWVGLSRQLPEKTYLKVNGVSSLWVKGDGSGAILNVQVQRAPEFARAFSENFVRLDFKGWRRVDLLIRERDADLSDRYVWPYEQLDRLNTPGSVFRCVIGGKTANKFTFWLNDIPPGGKTEVLIGAWDSISQAKTGLDAGATVRINGTEFAVPFALASGERAELKDCAWWHYAEDGTPLARQRTDMSVRLNEGDNAFQFSPAANAQFSRVEVTVQGLGMLEPAFTELSADQRGKLAVEYERPGVLKPSDGLTGPFSVRVRPGETARLGFEILGPVKNPIVMGRRMNVTLADAQERILCEDGKSWKAVRVVPGAAGPENRTKSARRETIADGVFGKPLPVLASGTTRVEVTAESAEGARITFFKRYEATNFDFVSAGKAAPIRLSKSAGASSRHAAEELAHYIGKMTSARPEIMTSNVKGPCVVIGTLSTLKDVPCDIRRKLNAEKSGEASVLSVRGETFWIVGKESVAELYAVYRLLDRLGVRWLQVATKEDPGEFVPTYREIALEPFEEYRAPKFSRRCFNLVASAPWPIATNSVDYLLRNGFQPHSSGCGPYPIGEEHRMHDLGSYTNFWNARWSPAEQSLGGGHVMFFGAIPATKYYETHPEYFALVDGKRTDYRKNWQRAQYCLSNPEVQRLVADSIIGRLERYGGKGYYLYGNADSVYGWCECTGCRALDPPGAAAADVSTRFNKVVAKIDARVRARFPDAHLVLWAYSNYRELPFGVRHDPRMAVEFCDHGRCQAHRLDDSTCGRNVQMLKLLKGWLGVVSSLHTYEYLSCSDWNYSCCERMEADTLRLYRKLGVRGLSNEGHYPDAAVVKQYASPGFFDNQPSNWQYFYAVGRLMWNPDLDVETLLEEGESLYYGKAAEVMRRYHQFRRKLWDSRRECMGYSLGNQRTPMLLSLPGSRERLLGWLDEADRIATATNDRVLERRLKNDRKWLTTYWIKPWEKVQARMGSTLYAPRPTTAIVVDGSDDEGAWAGAQYVSDFGRPADPECYKPASKDLATTVGMLADDDAWYFFVRAKDPASRKAKFADGIYKKAWDGCGVEFFLFPPSVENRYYQIAANPNGVVTAVARSDGEVLTVPIRAAGKVLDGKWTLEIRIPMKNLFRLKSNDIWKINICRNRSIRDSLTPDGANLSLHGIGYHDTTDYQSVSIGKPYLVNGSFSDLDDNGRPKGWELSGRCEVVSTNGERCVCVRGNVLQSMWHGALRQSADPRRFTYSFRAKGPGKVKISFSRYHDEADPKAKNGYRRTFFPNCAQGGTFETTGEWAVYSGEHTIAADEWEAICLSAEGVSIDDVSVGPIK